MRDFNLIVPRDYVASNTEKESAYALDQMKNILKADARPGAEVSHEVEPLPPEAQSRPSLRAM
jgi:hypothetical protein